MPGSVQFLASSSQLPVPAAPHFASPLHPAARGALLCFCHGEVIEMRGPYGWLKAHGTVDHPLADTHDGHVFVYKKDVMSVRALATGDAVTFYLYVDGKGLGAERCELQCAPTTPTVLHGTGWYAKPSWNDRHGRPQSQASPQPVCYMPFGFKKAEPAPNAAAKADPVVVEIASEHVTDPAKLQTVGSVGHEDGACKRCAFFPKGRCLNGSACNHCHYDHTSRKRLRTRKPRVYAKELHEASLLEDDDEEVDLSTATCNDDRKAEILAPEDQSSKEAEDCFSEEDILDAATHAPSSSYPSDDEDGTLDSSSVNKSSLSETSDSETASDPGRSSAAPADSSPNSSYSVEESASAGPLEGFALSPMSWSAQMRIRRESAFGLSRDVSAADITRMTRALLNKLTHERFESLCGQILSLPITAAEHLTALAAEIFEKATSQDCFRYLYTDLCLRLDKHFAQLSGDIGGKAFRKALVAECQATFYKNLQPANPSMFEGLKGDEPFELEMKLKTQRLGNMRFIGDLLVHRLLAAKLMPPIILELLDGDEMALESLIAFLTIVAPCFEQEVSLYQTSLRDAFAALRRKMTDQGLSSRLRCHLSDLFDARARGWAVRSA